MTIFCLTSISVTPISRPRVVGRSTLSISSGRMTGFSEGTTEIPAKPFFQNSGKIAGPSVRVAADEENQNIAKMSVIT